MIIMNLELNHIYGFENFKINFTYPKKIIRFADRRGTLKWQGKIPIQKSRYSNGSKCFR